MALEVPDDVVDALQAVRSDDSPEDFMLAGYDSDSSLKLLGCGEGGTEELKSLLLDGDVCYGLIRKEFTWEKVGNVTANTTKFILVWWQPDGIPLKRKMNMGRFEGQIKKLFSSYQVTLDISDASEISEEIVEKLIADITMTADKSTSRRSNSMFFGGKRLSWKKSGAAKSSVPKMKPDSATEFKVIKGANVKFEDEEGLKEAIADVRNDKSSTRWCLASYVSKDTIALTATGDGDVSEMLDNCTDTQMSYGLFRLEEHYDRTVATKFCFVVWSPENVPPMTKAITSTHKGAVAPLFHPYHQDFTVSEKDELTEDIALEKISGLTGSRSHVTERKQEKKKSVYERQFLGGVRAGTQTLAFADEDAIMDAIKDVRNDKTDTTWVVVSFEGEKKNIELALAGTGSGDFESMANAFDDDHIMFGLFRTEEVIDRSTTIKFYFVQWQGPNVSMQHMGNCGVFNGAVHGVFQPFHDDVFGSTVDELIGNARKIIQNM